MYYNRKCSYFYIGLLGVGCVLILTTIVDGFKVAQSPTFIAVELFLNVLIALDLTARLYLVGFKKYMGKSCWNKLDVAIVIGCNLLFIMTLLSHVSFEYISEEILLVAWSIAQSFRMIMIAR